MNRTVRTLRSLAFALGAGLLPQPLAAGSQAALPVLPAPTYADLADLADSAPAVVRAQVRSMVAIEPGRARGVAPGRGRFFIEGRTEALVSGSAPLGERLRFLADLPLDAKGKPPKLKKTSVLVFARPVSGRPEELQLVAPDGLVAWTAEVDGRLRSILSELLGAEPPPRITGVREALYVPGNLAGEGETQMFLTTPGGEPAAITVVHRPGERPRWSVSFTELLAPNAPPPARDTLAWYRLACFLPQALPAAANVSGDAASREQAAQDYALIRRELGDCPRNRH